jgi:hypothetical protein
MVIKHIKKFFGIGQTTTVEAPYKIETPAVPPTVVATPPASSLDPVAVALDLEPMDFSAPAKKTRKPRSPKAVGTVKEKATKAPAKKPAAIKAAKKPVSKKSKKI